MARTAKKRTAGKATKRPVKRVTKSGLPTLAIMNKRIKAGVVDIGVKAYDKSGNLHALVKDRNTGRLKWARVGKSRFI